MEENITNEVVSETVDTAISAEKLSLDTNETSEFNENFTKYEEIYNSAKSMSLMDLEVGIKRLKLTEKQLENDQFNIDGFQQFSESILTVKSAQEANPNGSLTWLNTDSSEYMNLMDIKKKSANVHKKAISNSINIKIYEKIKSEREISDMSELDKVLEKLEMDLKMINDGTSTNKKFVSSNISAAIERIKEISECADASPLQKILDTIPTDKRLREKLKSYDYATIDKVFGKGFFKDFHNKLLAFYENRFLEYRSIALAAITAFTYSMAVKIESSMKSKDYKSVVYKACMVKYVYDLPADSEISNSWSTAFFNFFFSIDINLLKAIDTDVVANNLDL